MNKEEIIEIAVKAAAEYLEKRRQKEVKSRHDKRLRNTRLLLKNYNLFKEHCQKSVYNVQQAATAENAIDILDDLENYDRTTYIQSIKKSVTRTGIILTHIDTMLNLYRVYCESSPKEEDARRYRILKAHYLDGYKISAIVENENIDERTYYRDMKDACDKISALVFGIDGISEMSE